MAELFLDRQHVGEHLCRMILIRQSVPYRNTCIFGQFLHNLLSKSTILDSIKHSSENSCCIFDTFFLPDLWTWRIKVSRSHTHIVSSYFGFWYWSFQRSMPHSFLCIYQPEFLFSFFLLILRKDQADMWSLPVWNLSASGNFCLLNPLFCNVCLRTESAGDAQFSIAGGRQFNKIVFILEPV